MKSMNTSIITLPPEYGSAALSGRMPEKHAGSDILLRCNTFFLTRHQLFEHLASAGNGKPKYLIPPSRE